MHFPVLLAAMLAMTTTTTAHMHMAYPLQLEAAANPYSKNIDYSIDSPLAADGSNFPCKNAQNDGAAALTSVATWSAGAKLNFTVAGGAPHGGGSCQASLSFDGAKTFTVIHSYIGGCPMSSGQSFDFTVPTDSPTGAALFAWTWVNAIGNREYYMACSSVTIAAGSGAAPAMAFSSRPTIFVANLNNGCNTVESTNPVFPDPGPDVTIVNPGAPGFGITGTCAAVKGNGGTTASGGSTTPQTPSSSQAAASSSKPTGSAVFASSKPSSTASPALGLTIHPDGQCTGAYTCAGSPHGSCCSSYGWCGSTDAYCGKGCQAGFGTCGNSTTPIYVNSTSAAKSSQVTRSSIASLITASMITASLISGSATTVTATARSSRKPSDDDAPSMVTVTMTVNSTMTTTVQKQPSSVFANPLIASSSKLSGFVAVTTGTPITPTTFCTSFKSSRFVQPTSTASKFVHA